tara:strand:- start:1509 stop:2147 length:639 start_codon:yes stop_codon:yes gene_type:complete
MYFIVNKTKRPVIIADLKLELKPRQAIDIDKIYDRHKTDNSRDLGHAVKSGYVHIRQKTIKNLDEADATLLPAVEAPPPVDAEKIKEELRKEFQQQMATLSDTIKSSVANPEMMQVLKQLSGAIQDGQLGTTVVKEKETVREVAVPIDRPVEEDMKEDHDGDDDLDPAIAAQIHAKAVDRLTKQSKGKVAYQEEHTEGSVSKNVDELDNLMG